MSLTQPLSRRIAVARNAKWARNAGLAPATHTWTVDETLRVPMSDGTVLRGTRWIPDGEQNPPLVIMRTPYGRAIAAGEEMLLAERGYQVLVVSVRGTFDSEGTFDPFRHEWSDGTDTLAWVEEQEWFPGRAALAGASYVGHTQWAVAAKPPAWLRAHCMSVTTTEIRDGVIYPEGAFNLDTATVWLWALANQEKGTGLSRTVRVLTQAPRALRRAQRVLPLRDADKALVGHEIPHYQDWLANEDLSAPYWTTFPGFGESMANARPVAMLSGWNDIFCTNQLRDFTRLQEAGVPVHLEIGPWHHASPELARATRTLWHDHLADQLRPVEAPSGMKERPGIRAHLGGTGEVVELASWPPPATVTVLHPSAGGALAAEAGTGVGHYTYDPADPTPARGGRTLNPFRAGYKNQAPRERREDVLTYTGPVLTEDLTVAGDTVVELRVRPSSDHVDYVPVLCDVDERGRSTNVTYGVLKLSRLLPEGRAARDAEGWLTLRVPLAPTGHTFRRGHRVRLQLSSGFFPIIPANAGIGDSIGTASRLVPSQHEVDLAASAVELPVLDRSRL